MTITPIAAETLVLQRAFDLAARFPDLDSRIDRAYDIATLGLVSTAEDGDGWTVASQSHADHAYLVLRESPTHWTCTCPDTGRAFGGMCKHVLAVMLLTGLLPPNEEGGP